MNLNFYLLVRITLVAIICLLATGAYVLYRADLQSKQQSQSMLESVSKQLQVQLLQIDTGLGRLDQFPDLSLWTETHSISGICIQYIPSNNTVTRSICRGSEWHEQHSPQLFESIYPLFFTPGLEIVKQVIFKDQIYGSVSVIPSAEMELNNAWQSIRALLELSFITILTVCILVYISITRALRPAQSIVSGLEKMQQGDLKVRIPHFDLLEWQQTSSAINQLAANQQLLLSERKKLTFKLISLQDEERRYLARELHDELGQCLAAINALTASITHTAKQQCPDIAEDAQSLSRINEHIMGTVRNLLVKLRPTEIDELGLELSLNSLVSEWNSHRANKINYQLIITGDCQQLFDPYPITLFRIIQECLTNIAKHSSATSASIKLDIKDKLITLLIEDNGNIDSLPFIDNSGFGLLGISERVSSLGGLLQLSKNESDGLSTLITLPFNDLDLKYDD